MTKKEAVLSVILGVAIMSLITSVIVVSVDSFAMLFDYVDVNRTSDDYAYPYVIGGLELFFAVIVICFSIIALAHKGKTRNIIIFVFGIVTALFFIITVIVLRLNVEGKYDYYGDYYISKTDYTLFTSYLTMAVTLTVSVIVTVVSYFMLSRSKAEQTPAAPEQKPEPSVGVNAEEAAQGGHFCAACGKKNTSTAQFCSQCGKKLN